MKCYPLSSPKKKLSRKAGEIWLFGYDFWTLTNDQFLSQPWQSSLIFEIWITCSNGWFDLIGTPTVLSMHSWSKITELDFCFRHRYATVHVQWDARWSVSSFVSFLKPLGTSFLESLKRTGFQQTHTCNTIACYSSITYSDLNQQQIQCRFALQLND